MKLIKKTRLLLLLVLYSIINLNAQIDTSIKFNKTASGRNFSSDISKVFNEKHEIGIGFRYNINSLKHPDDQGNIFYRRQYATKPWHHIGLRVFYHRKILPNWRKIEPFMFFDLQATHTTTRNVWYWPYAFDTSSNQILYNRFEENFGPFTWVEQSIGLGYKVKLTKNIFITSQFGLEGMLIFGRDDELVVTWGKGPNFEFGYLFDFGIGYRFENRTKTNKK
ncbi:MAG TPA: hypothetical protein EYG92_06965 [Lutibacter sp.]|nr:hypothetical protein [Lutibacter sp.]